MAKQVRDLMNKQPIKVSGSTTVIEAARQMREGNIGAVIIEDQGRLSGIVTDRDIAVRAVAAGRDPNTTRVVEIASKDPTTLRPDDDLDKAVEVMRNKAIRRVPVVDDRNSAVGVLSLGDLALERDPRSALGRISAAPPNQ
jgi:CBS domain-containing protein